MGIRRYKKTSAYNSPMRDYKQVILCRTDLKMSKGKLAAQVSHASVETMVKSHKDDIENWRDQGMKKSILKVISRQQLFYYKRKAEDAGLVCGLIIDAGHTQLKPGTPTCLGIGPDKEEKIDAVTGKLKLI